MKRYKHLFFDLDHTLWDYNANAEETLAELFDEFGLQQKGVPSFRAFLHRYHYHNDFCWSAYRNGKIDVEEVRLKRFLYALGDFEINKKDIAYQIAELYIDRCPDKINLMPYARKVLETLSARYPLHLITNGFHHVQIRKLNNTNLGQFFSTVITADIAGALKPSKKIFDHALKGVNTSAADTVYIGDHLEADIAGARNAGMDQVYYNPGAKPHHWTLTHEIKCLSELPRLFP